MISNSHVQRTTATYSVENISRFKQQMLSWVNRFNICCFLDNHQYAGTYNGAECLVGAGAISYVLANQQALLKLDAYTRLQKDWLFGHLSYDLKAELENIPTSHQDFTGFPLVYLFQPEVVIEIKDHTVIIHSATTQPAVIIREILEEELPVKRPAKNAVSFTPRISKEKYLDLIEQVRAHILRGDCYELNFCQEFFAEHILIDPLETYRQLTTVSPTPFAGYYKLEDKFLLCASPERYLKKTGNKIISQPIKGTLQRNTGDANHDQVLKERLYNSSKDRSENVMVVDLVRNDLSKICKEGSVQVEELFGIYSFPQVHQMISTIQGELQPGISFADIISASFPMGSMTGAPKHNVIQLIERYEQSARGIYSGALGYISPDGDFDFNVVIRSIMYNAGNQYLSYQVGGGITFYSDAEKEYEECMLKASAIELLFSKS